jgi:hypothetical protein
MDKIDTHYGNLKVARDGLGLTSVLIEVRRDTDAVMEEMRERFFARGTRVPVACGTRLRRLYRFRTRAASALFYSVGSAGTAWSRNAAI